MNVWMRPKIRVLNRKYSSRLVGIVWASLTLMAGCDTDDLLIAVPEAPLAADVDATRIINADQEPNNWLAHGRTYDEQRYSPLTQITVENVADLGLDWLYAFETRRGMEATPIVVDGVIYVSGSWSRIYALRAVTGELLWEYDPRVPPGWAINVCCDVVNRGVAVWKGRVYFGTLDGRLIALDAQSGRLEWSVQTTPTDKPYSITGAPRIVKGKVIIGNGGAEFGVRGFVTAYDAATGERAWRFYTTPGNPGQARLKIPRWPWQPLPGKAASGGRSAAAEPFGIRWPMTPTWTCCTLA